MFGRRFSFCFFIFLITLSDRSTLVMRSIPVSYKSLLNVELPQPTINTSSRGFIYLQRTSARSMKSEYLKQDQCWISYVNHDEAPTIRKLLDRLYQKIDPNNLGYEIHLQLLVTNSFLVVMILIERNILRRKWSSSQVQVPHTVIHHLFWSSI